MSERVITDAHSVMLIGKPRFHVTSATGVSVLQFQTKRRHLPAVKQNAEESNCGHCEDLSPSTISFLISGVCFRYHPYVPV